MISILNKQGLLEKIDMAQITNFKNIDERLKNQEYDPGNQFTVPYQWGTSCLVVDTSKVSRPITKWADLWDPEFAGKIVLLDDEREVIGMVLEVLGYDKNSTDHAQLEEAKVKLSELMPSVKLFDSDNPKQALLAGEVWLGQTWNGEASIAHGENEAIQRTEEGSQSGLTTCCPKSAAHLDAAHVYQFCVMENSVLIQRIPTQPEYSGWKSSRRGCGYVRFYMGFKLQPVK
jgi:spermidine/putrescine transport system substrate-binding protein